MFRQVRSPRDGRQRDVKCADRALDVGATETIPAEYIIRPRLVVPRKTGEEMLRKADDPRPTRALRKLMRDGD